MELSKFVLATCLSQEFNKLIGNYYSQRKLQRVLEKIDKLSEQKELQFINHGVTETFLSQLLAMDASARVTMKDAAKCDKRREWQNSENQENAERILHFQVLPGSMSTSGQ